MNEPNSPETPETFADAVTKLRTFGAFPDQARIDAVVAAHEREIAEMNKRITGQEVYCAEMTKRNAELRREMNNRAIIAAASIADGETAKKD